MRRLRYTRHMGAKSPKSIGEQVSEARIAAGMTQQELADKIGVTRGFLAKLEVGMDTAVNPTFQLILALEAVLAMGWIGDPLAHYVDAKRKELGIVVKRKKR